MFERKKLGVIILKKGLNCKNNLVALFKKADSSTLQKKTFLSRVAVQNTLILFTQILKYYISLRLNTMDV